MDEDKTEERLIHELAELRIRLREIEGEAWKVGDTLMQDAVHVSSQEGKILSINSEGRRIAPRAAIKGRIMPLRPRACLGVSVF